MAIDMGAAARHAGICRECAGDISSSKAQLSRFSENINLYWSSGEMKYINMKIEGILNVMQSTITDLQNLDSDIYNAASEIAQEEREEEERKQRELAEENDNDNDTN